jgi:LysM repeat protein
VKKGETLSVIARNYGVAVNDLTQANRISAKTSLKIGQEILIPVSGASGPRRLGIRFSLQDQGGGGQTGAGPLDVL